MYVIYFCIINLLYVKKLITNLYKLQHKSKKVKKKYIIHLCTLKERF